MTAATTAQVTATTWNIDPVHTSVQFKVKHMMISNVKGEFSAVTGKLTLDSANPSNSQVTASIDAAPLTLATHSEMRT
jgi:polyisoprenoid-binding protein YceI